MISWYDRAKGSRGTPERPCPATVRELALGLTTRRDGAIAHGQFVVVYEDLMVAAEYAVVDD